MSNPIFDVMRPTQPNMMQAIQNFAKTITGNPEQIVRGLISSGKMTQQQFNTFSTMANQMFPGKK